MAKVVAFDREGAARIIKAVRAIERRTIELAKNVRGATRSTFIPARAQLGRIAAVNGGPANATYDATCVHFAHLDSSLEGLTPANREFPTTGDNKVDYQAASVGDLCIVLFPEDGSAPEIIVHETIDTVDCGGQWREAWADATAYVVGDTVKQDGAVYIAEADHTSGSGTKPGIGASWDTVWDLHVAAGEGVPTGGAADEVLVKSTATDFDTAWRAPLEVVEDAIGGVDRLVATDDTGDAYAVPVADDQLVGHLAAGVIAGLSPASCRTLLNVADGADVSPVTSVFGRTGVVAAAAGDYDAALVDNDGSAPGATVEAALENLVQHYLVARHDTLKLDATGSSWVPFACGTLQRATTGHAFTHSTVNDDITTDEAGEFWACLFGSMLISSAAGSFDVRLEVDTGGGFGQYDTVALWSVGGGAGTTWPICCPYPITASAGDKWRYAFKRTSGTATIMCLAGDAFFSLRGEYGE